MHAFRHFWVRRVVRPLLMGYACLLGFRTAQAQMVSPDIDRPGEPFSYPSHPTDEIGVPDAPSATEITPEGYLYTGFGELMFFVGPDHQPISPRLHTLAKGYLPILSYEVARDGVSYHFEMFSATLNHHHDGPVANFVRVTASNLSGVPRAAFLTTAVRYQADSQSASGSGDNRFRRPVKDAPPGDYQQPGETFDPDWTYGFSADAFVRNGEVLYLFPESPKPELDLTLEEHYSNLADLRTRMLNVATTTPTGAASYTLRLQPGERRSLDFIMPLIPVRESSEEVAQFRIASFDAYRESVVAWWEKTLSGGMQITLPEKKVVDTFNASLVYDLLARNRIGDDYIQTVNQLHYHSFYLRDASDIVHMYDVTGYPVVAEQVLRFYHTKQLPDGNFLSQRGQYDGWGQALWIYGEHYRLTLDHKFAEAVYPSMVKAVGWFEEVTAADPMHLMPATDVKDNEYVPGHLTGYNFLALDGLQSAQYLAQELGHADDAARFQKDYDSFRANFLAILDRLTKKTGGYIPPDMDDNHMGADWGNLLSVTPAAQLDPHDPRVTATLRESQSRYQEGIMTYSQPDQGQYLHHYLTIKNTLTEVIRGDQEQALHELYAELLHTSSTQAGFEYAIRPWGDRDFKGNLTPHGWFAAEYRNLLRSMFLREQGNSLHILSVTSPQWIGKGNTISIKQAPSYFGEVNYELVSRSDTMASLDFGNKFIRAPESIVVHIPWFVELQSASADGNRLRAMDGRLVLPASVKHVELFWHRRASLPDLSYQSAVRDYKAEYRKRYEQLLRDGTYYHWQPAGTVGGHN